MYQKLFEQGKIGKLDIKSRTVMPAMGVNYSTANGEATNQEIEYYKARAKGGIGLIITGITNVDGKAGRACGNQLSAASEGNVRSLRELADAVHTYDTKIFGQIHHAGIQTSSRITGFKPEGPSALASKVVGEVAHELTIEEIKKLEGQFIAAAVRLKNAEFDGVEIHAAHGYLISSFLSPLTNKREDEYGGSLENRMRILLNILGGIKAYCGKDFAVSIRLNSTDHVEGGLEFEECLQIAKILEKAGADCINLSGGTYESGYTIIEPSSIPQGWKKDYAKKLKENLSIPVIAVNNIKDPEVAEALLEEGVSDYVGLGRASLADPEWTNKAKSNRDKYIRKCVGCMNCFAQLMKYDRPVTCTVNPELSKEYLYTDLNKIINKTGEGKKVVVIGAGPAGSEAALVLADRGFDVTIFDKNEGAGGSIRLGAKPPFKSYFNSYIAMLEASMEEAGVDIRFNEEANLEKLKALDPYGVVVAVGGKPAVLDIKGLACDKALTYADILSEDIDFTGKNVLVIGGGETGLETGEFLKDKGNDVKVIEMQEEIGKELEAASKGLMLKRFADKGIPVLTNTTVKEVNDGKASLVNLETKEESQIEFDYIVLAVGVKNDPAYNKDFIDNFDKVIVVGDARKPRNIVLGAREAYDKAFVF